MATLPIFNVSGEEVGAIEVSDHVFAGEVRRHLFYEVVKWQLAKRRSGSHKTKGRSEVSGGGAKPYRQKGTGRARQGTRRAPQFVGGGVVHGPRPRSYDYPLNKKVRRGALRAALSLRAQAGDLVVVQNLELNQIRTRHASGVFERLAEGDLWDFAPGDRRYVVRNEGSLVALEMGSVAPSEAGFRLLLYRSNDTVAQLPIACIPGLLVVSPLA